ncbi:DMT family transporter [Fulvivirga sp. M361]|uniref:DMT family transporter n=1 Tax=Fulvivirga sp. M361 TaxID=2594266 RepID=UPI0016294798|nr:DMT family transporter [Fulvivirga sp. M361]
MLLLLATLWGPSFLFIKVAIVEIPPVTLAALRIGIGAVFINLYLYMRGGSFIKELAFWKHVTIAGFFAHALPFILINWGEQYIDSAMASILNGLTPLFTIVMANFVIEDDKMDVKKILGTILGFIGLMVLISPSLISGIKASVLGVVAVGIGAASYGVALVYSRLNLKAVKPVYAPASQLLVTAVYLVPFAFLTDGPVNLASLSFNAIGSVLILAVPGTAMAFVVYYKVLEKASASYLSLVTYLMPIYGVVLGVTVLGETITMETFIGAILILSGIAIVNGILRLPKWKMKVRRVKAENPVCKQ